jgi:hypothetical protein
MSNIRFTKREKVRTTNFMDLAPPDESIHFDPVDTTQGIITGSTESSVPLREALDNSDALAQLFTLYFWYYRNDTRAMREIAQYPALAQLMMHLRDQWGIDEDKIKLASYLAFARARTWANNSNYLVAPGLLQQLQETKLTGVTCADIKLPFDVITVHLSRPVPLKTYKVYKLALFIEQFQDTRILTIIAFARHIVNAKDNFIVLPIPLMEDATFDTTIAHQMDKETETLDEDGTNQTLMGLCNLVANTIMYATWPDADILDEFTNPQAKILWNKIQGTPPSKRRDRLQAMLDSMDTTKHKVLGSSIIYISRQQAEKEDNDLAQQTGKKLVLRVRVAGHWTNQAHGPRHSLRKRIWIQPYWKGPEDGFLKPQTRVLKMQHEAKVC